MFVRRRPWYGACVSAQHYFLVLPYQTTTKNRSERSETNGSTEAASVQEALSVEGHGARTAAKDRKTNGSTEAASVQEALQVEGHGARTAAKDRKTNGSTEAASVQEALQDLLNK